MMIPKQQTNEVEDEHKQYKTKKNDDKENVAELYVVDDETIIIGGDLMEGLDDDLDKFLNDLLK